MATLPPSDHVGVDEMSESWTDENDSSLGDSSRGSCGDDGSVAYSDKERPAFDGLEESATTTSVFRRRAVASTGNGVVGEDDNEHSLDFHEGENRQRKRASRNMVSVLRSQAGSVILVLAATTWLFVQVMTSEVLSLDDSPALRKQRAIIDKLKQERNHRPMTPGEMALLRKERMQKARKALGSAAKRDEKQPAFWVDKKGVSSRKKGETDELPRGCKYTAWQRHVFPTCNHIHELDLLQALHLHKGSKKLPDMGRGDTHGRRATPEELEEAAKVGYVGSGFWRTVWKVYPRGPVGFDYKLFPPTVLKMMKGEHDFDHRNYDRHRRDALAMERASASPNVVSIYGYCSNTVLTEYLDNDLDKIIYHGDHLESFPTRTTPAGRLRLALDVARGAQAIHEVPGGPIIHADIQAKQFLVGADGRVKLNDFNRCRFIPNRNGTICPVTIPTAPGAYRSPEEYEHEPLTTKADIYSVAHVLYGILTGREPWSYMQKSMVKTLIRSNKKPQIPSEYLIPNTTDAALATLVQMAYERDPDNRISARELVRQLERLQHQTTSPT